MPIVRGQVDKFLVPGARNVYIDDYNELPSFYNQIFTVETSSKAFEDDLVATGLPIAVSKPEGEPIKFDRAKYRGRVRYVHAGYGLGYEITYETIEDNLYKPLNSQGASNLAMSMRAAEETTAAAVLNGAFTTVQGYDGVSLLNATHTGVDGTTYANRPAADADISVSALKSATERFMDLKNDRNIRINMMPSVVLTGIFNYWTVQEILGTQVVKGAASGGETTSIISDRAINIVTQMGLQPMKWAYLTDTDAWFLLAPKSQTKLKFYWRRKPQDVSGSDDRTGIAWYGITGRWVAGATDWRGLDGSTGA